MTESPKKENVLLAKWRLLLLASTDPDVTKSDLAVLAFILDSINRKTKIAFPALTRISKHARVDRGTATRSIKRLEQLEYISKKSGDRVRANEYRMGQGRCVVATTPSGRCADATTPSGGAAGSCWDATKVGAGTPHGVGAGMRLQPMKEQPMNRTHERAHTPPGAVGGEKIDQKKATTLDDFLKTVAPGEYVFDKDHPVSKYQSNVDMSDDLMILTWDAFKDRYCGTGATQLDWRKWFLRYLKENWGRLWRMDDGVFVLTSVGEQKKIEMEARTGRTLDVC